MVCPKCDEGQIKKILFKKSEWIGFLCDFCGTAWLGGENVSETSGCPIRSLTNDEDMDYTFIDIDEKDEGSKSVMYPNFK